LNRGSYGAGQSEEGLGERLVEIKVQVEHLQACTHREKTRWSII
jgi:hypothetical protein